MTEFDGTEVAKHNTNEDCWVVINGKIWDVSEFLRDHPGGASVIAAYSGRDATDAYNEIHDPELVIATLPAAKCLGEIRSGTLPESQQKLAALSTTAAVSAIAQYPPLWSVVNVAGFEKVAKRYLSPTGWAYYAGGAEDEVSLMDTGRLFRMITFRPRILRRVEPVSTAVKILGFPSSLPIYISPTGSGRYAYPNAESVLARAAGKEGVVYCMPTTAAHESVFEARSSPDQPLFFQLYTTRKQTKALAMIKKLKALGAGALFLTVDSPVLSRRERDEQAKVTETPGVSSGDLKWIQQATSMPLILKGVQTVEDAVLAYDHGIQGIVLSNHGGRSLDTAQAPIITLLEIRKHAPHLLAAGIRDKFQVFIDGGFRRGTDVLKALALGASAVGIGRPFLYSMTAGYGEAGAVRLLQMFRAEIETNMALAGATAIEELVPEMVNSERAESEMSRRIKL
ncbi:hypothetical protein NUW58_g5223 [Xylaria curta]|uniref:Uncharacterized protein n=1 Tax=Xylaria curta TaxID=42375 RepID=A0ACC1P2S1_9PEZI|nr:hypothetical protein NUW58_g5223 [Xylaria curta]